MNLLEIKNLKMDFGKNAEALRAIDDVSFNIGTGETVCLVGESGCGKTVTALSIARLVASPPANYVGGEILLNGRDTLKMSARELQQIRGGVVSYVFQDPGASLNPVFRIGNQIKESLKLHKPEKANDAEVIRLLKLVGIPAPESRIKNYPFEMSGGMQQRVMIAMALASEPKLLVADEPTTALDVTIQAQILDFLSELKQRLGMAILLITHNLGIVGDMADRVAVMYAGQIVELSPAQRTFAKTISSLHESADEFRAETARRRRPPLGHSRQCPAHRQFPARLPVRPALPDCQTGMFRKNPRTARSRTRTFREVPVLENKLMRDNHDKLPEILEALKENENFFCVVAIERAEQTKKFRFGISHESYLALKQLSEIRPFDQMPGIPYRYFFVPNVQRLDDGRIIDDGES